MPPRQTTCEDISEFVVGWIADDSSDKESARHGTTRDVQFWFGRQILPTCLYIGTPLPRSTNKPGLDFADPVEQLDTFAVICGYNNALGTTASRQDILSLSLVCFCPAVTLLSR